MSTNPVDLERRTKLRADLSETVVNVFASRSDSYGPEPANVYGQAQLIAGRLLKETDSVVFRDVEKQIETRKKVDNNWTFANMLTAALSLVGSLGLSHDDLERIEAFREMPMPNLSPVPSHQSEDPSETKVFVVHGHDGNVKYEVVRFLEEVTGERPIVLHEQPDKGRTIIEKLEDYAAMTKFAVVLLTADDEGRAKNSTELRSRSRQNVVLEFGYLMSRLGRARVVALYESGVELPSDVSGLLYKQLDGNWKWELQGELEQAGIDTGKTLKPPGG